MNRAAALAALIVLQAVAPRANAISVRSVQARFDAPSYHVSMVAELDARPEDVEAVLVDYRKYPLLDPRIRASEVLSGTSGASAVVRTRVRFCAGFFCRTIDRVENVRHHTGELVATVDPDRSQLRSGRTRTTWHTQDQHTYVVYEADFAPAFWVPEIIARRYAAPALQDATVALFTNVEREANARRQ
jgi:polyketide cyclase/dehydrase/lipid transport protein